MTITLARAKHRVKPNSGDTGFSMVELVVAMMVLSVILLILAAVQISSLITVTEARKLQQATAFANEAVEQMHAIPWNALSKGMYSDFLGVSGGDPDVSSGYIDVDGPTGPIEPVPLQIADPSNDQDLSNPARPLFDEYGSHIQERTDASLTGTQFRIKAYVTDASGGKSDAAVGIVVIVEWPNRYGGMSRTTVQSEAYRGSLTSCGSAETQPFLAACQSFFEASASSGYIAADVSATTVDPDPVNIVAIPLMYPAAQVEYSVGMRSATAAASMSSQQVNFADAIIQYGKNVMDDGDPATPIPIEDEKGFVIYQLRASDDATNQSGWELDPADQTTSQSTTDEEETVVLQTGVSPLSRFRVRSDYGRTGTLDPSMTTSCMTGSIPDGQPCAFADIQNDPDYDSGSGYLWMVMKDGSYFRLSRRLSEAASTSDMNGNYDKAWAARFVSEPGSSEVGCTSISGPGCVSAGASRTMAELRIGDVATGTEYTNGDASRGMVVLKGDASCPSSYNGYYGETVMVQRGQDQKTTAGDFERCGLLEYWNGTGYTPVLIDNSSEPFIETAPVTWTSGDDSITATTQVQILAAYEDSSAEDLNCASSACTVNVSGGTIVIVSSYDIVFPSHEFMLVVSTYVSSPSAQASYTAAPSV